MRAPVTDSLVSIVIVTHDDAAMVSRCLRELERTRYPAWEVIVVDNASTDETVQTVRDAELDVELILNEVGRGPGVANNQGARVARGELLVFMNPDVWVNEDWLSILVARLHDHPDVGIISPTMLAPGEAAPPPGTPLRESAGVSGASMMVRRAAWEDLGGFDETFFLYWDDTELCFRTWLLGWRILIDPEATVVHEAHGSVGSANWAPQQIRNGLYTYLKLMRGRQVAVCVVMMAAKTAANLGRAPTRELLEAWTWNLRNLGVTLDRRRLFAARRRCSPGRIERRVSAHRRRQLRARRERRRLARR